MKYCKVTDIAMTEVEFNEQYHTSTWRSESVKRICTMGSHTCLLLSHYDLSCKSHKDRSRVCSLVEAVCRLKKAGRGIWRIHHLKDHEALVWRDK